MDTDGLAQMVGHTALVEVGGLQATGTVASVDAASVTIACDETKWDSAGVDEATVSIFAPDALYRLSGPGVADGSNLIVRPMLRAERVQRRKWPRRRLDLPVTVCPVADGRRLEGIPGRTVDVGVGGVCVETLRPVEGEGDPMVIMSLPDGTTIVSLTSTVGVEDLGDGWRYRLAFRHLDAHEASRIAELVG